MFRIKVLIWLPIVLILTQCSSYNDALRNALVTIKEAGQFRSLFPESTHSWTYYTGEYGRTTYCAYAGFYERYILAMKIEVVLNSDKTKVISSGKPDFAFWDVQDVRSSSGLPNRLFIQFGLKEWNDIIAAGGDIEKALHVKLNKTSPVPHFEEELKH